MKIRSLASILALQTIFTFQLQAVDIIAHRGASFDAPENTLSAMNLGWELKSDGCELDTRQTKDGINILCHDQTFKKTAGLDKSPTDLTYDEIKDLDVGLWKGAKWTGEKLPTLNQALDTIPAGKTMFVEVKWDNRPVSDTLVPSLIRDFKKSGKTAEQITVIAFNYEIAKQMKAQAPAYPVYFLASNEVDKKTKQPKFTVEKLIQLAKEAKLDGLDLSRNFPINKEFVKKIQDAGLKLCIWTVNDPEEAKKLASFGVDSITTDKPDLIRAAIQ